MGGIGRRDEGVVREGGGGLGGGRVGRGVDSGVSLV